MVQSLTHTLLDVFDAARDLHQTLKSKQKRDYEANLRSRGYRRSVDYIDDGPDGEEEIVMDKAAVLRQFDNGLDHVGGQFAVGDGMESPIQLQHKFLYPFCTTVQAADTILCCWASGNNSAC